MMLDSIDANSNEPLKHYLRCQHCVKNRLKMLTYIE